MEHTVEEVRALFEAWAEENGYEVLRIEPDYNDGFTAAAWHGYQAAYAKRIEWAQSEVTDEVVQRAEQAFWPAYSECTRVHGARKNAHAAGMRAALLAVWPKPPAMQDDWRIGFFERWREAAHEKGYAGVAEAITAAPTAFLHGTAPAFDQPAAHLARVGEPIYFCYDNGHWDLATKDWYDSWPAEKSKKLYAASPINLAAVHEVIKSHINEAKNLRHDPELQNYLYEQANKLEAVLQENIHDRA